MSVDPVELVSLMTNVRLAEKLAAVSYGSGKLRLIAKSEEGRPHPHELVLEIVTGLPGTFSITSIVAIGDYGIGNDRPSFLTGNRELDTRFLVKSYETTITSEAFASREIQRLLLAALANAHEVRLKKGILSAGWAQPHLHKQDFAQIPDQILDCAKKLQALAMALTPWLNSNNAAVLNRLGRLYSMLSTGAIILGLVFWSAVSVLWSNFPVLNETAFIRYCLQRFVVILAFYIIWTFRLLRRAGASVSHSILYGLVFGAFWIGGATPAALCALNVFLDPSQPRSIRLVVDSKQVSDVKEDGLTKGIADFLTKTFPEHEHWFKNMQVIFLENVGPDVGAKVKLNVHQENFHRFQIGQEVLANRRAGYLGFPWLILEPSME